MDSKKFKPGDRIRVVDALTLRNRKVQPATEGGLGTVVGHEKYPDGGFSLKFELDNDSLISGIPWYGPEECFEKVEDEGDE